MAKILSETALDNGLIRYQYEGWYEDKSAPTAAPEPTAEEIAADARLWRDSELRATDQASQTPDWPNRNNILTYRTVLRDWPSTADFPSKKPVLG